MPREHGAYGQLGLPLLTALASGRPSAASVLLVVASVAAFFAHEPFRVFLGHRGTKAKRNDGARARVRAFALTALAAGAGGTALVLCPPARIAAVAVAPALGVVMILAFANVDRTSLGEVVAASALAGASVPVAVASSVGIFEALAAWGAWAFGLTVTTLGVRVVTSKSPAEKRSFPWIVALFVAAGVAAWAGGLTVLSAAAPLAIVALALAITRPEAKHVRRVGWVLIASVIATAAGLVAHARA